MAVMSLNALLKVACLELYQALNKCLRDVSHWGTQSNAPNLKDVHILISGACDYAMLHARGGVTVADGSKAVTLSADLCPRVRKGLGGWPGQ